VSRAIELTIRVLKALVRATEDFAYHRGDENRETLRSTVGIAFLGTPFQGSWQFGNNAAQLRIAVASLTDGELSQELVQYLHLGSRKTPSPLDELVVRFREMMTNGATKIDFWCFYETRATKFSAVGKKLPDSDAKKELEANGYLKGHEIVFLN
jgi:hypothetical protein